MTPSSLDLPVVVVVTWQAADLLEACLLSLRAQTQPHHVLVVDNASDDRTASMVAESFPEVTFLRNDRNLGFAGGVAQALAATDAEFVALLNNDARAEPGWLVALVEHLRDHPAAAAVTSLMLFDEAGEPTVNNTGVLLRPDRYGVDRGWGDRPADWSAADDVWGFSGGAALLRRSAVAAVGGFPAPFFLYYEDTDTSWRLRRAGWAIRYEPAAVVHHRHAASSDVRSSSFAFHNERNRLLMVARCAPLPEVLGVWARFVVTTVSLTAQGALGRRPPGHHFATGLRLRALGSALRLLPWAVRTRRSVGPGP